MDKQEYKSIDDLFVSVKEKTKKQIKENFMDSLVKDSTLLEDIFKIVGSEPNDKRLGKKIREIYWDIRECGENNQLNLFEDND